jgi:hypothetical protein
MDFSAQSFSVEHINPRYRNGETTLGNLALACQGCNGAKHTKTEALDPITQQIVPLFHPRQQKWTDHFAWNEDYMTVIGVTATGRATVQALKLNRLGVLNLRRALFNMGEHPPIDTIMENRL